MDGWTTKCKKGRKERTKNKGHNKRIIKKQQDTDKKEKSS